MNRETFNKQLHIMYNSRYGAKMVEPTISNNLLYVKDTSANRDLMTKKLGAPIVPSGEYTYIEVDMDNRTWRTCFTYEWIYRGFPQMTPIQDVFNKLDNKTHG